MSSHYDPRRPEKIKRYKSSYQFQFNDDQFQEYMNVFGMIFSMCGLMMKVTKALYSFSYEFYLSKNLKIKWCAWVSVLCSLIGFANARGGDDGKQILSCFM